MQETWVQPLGWEAPLKEAAATTQPSVLPGNPGDSGAWQASVHAVAKSQLQLSNSTTTIICI